MFEEIQEGIFYCPEYEFSAIENTTYEDVLLMLERGELDND